MIDYTFCCETSQKTLKQRLYVHGHGNEFYMTNKIILLEIYITVILRVRNVFLSFTNPFRFHICLGVGLQNHHIKYLSWQICDLPSSPNSLGLSSVECAKIYIHVGERHSMYRNLANVTKISCKNMQNRLAHAKVSADRPLTANCRILS